MLSRCLACSLLVQIAAIRSDDEVVGQLLPQRGAFESEPMPWMPSSQLERERTHVVNGTAALICQTPSPMGQGYKLHCDAQLAKIRSVFQVPDPEDILETSHIDLSHAEEGSGKSGAKMLFSEDKKYIIKTMSKRDGKALGPVINEYVSHIVGHSSSSAMMRIYAIIEDDVGGLWLIANNWLPVNFPVTWDLKGSMVGRSSGTQSPTQKDKDWLSQSKGLALPPSQRNSILQALQSDSAMLARSNLIDYSLIVGLLVYELKPCDGPKQPKCIAPICHPQGGCGEAAYNLGDYFTEIKDFYCAESSLRERQLGHTCAGGFTSGLKVYFQCFGIIDLLKPYDFQSKVEYGVKAGFVRQISAQPAVVYAQRFFQFMYEKVFLKDLSDDTTPLIFTPQSCGSWGSRKEGSSGSNNTLMAVIGLAVALLVAVGFGAWWFYFRKRNAATEVGGDLQAYQPDVQYNYGDYGAGHPQQMQQAYPSYDPDAQGVQGYQGYQGYPGYDQSPPAPSAPTFQPGFQQFAAPQPEQWPASG
eukprot:symbB.v1.2.016860.t1/scaffold1298.1/size126199/3